MNKFVILACSTAVGLMTATGSVSASDQKNWGYTWPALEAAWQIETTIRLDAEDCTTADPVGFPNPFPSFSMFHEGGTIHDKSSARPRPRAFARS